MIETPSSTKRPRDGEPEESSRKKKRLSNTESELESAVEQHKTASSRDPKYKPKTRLEFYTHTHRGTKRYNEDRRIAEPHLCQLVDNAALTENRYALFGVFDGHNGGFVSQYLKENFAEHFTKFMSKSPPHKMQEDKMKKTKAMLSDIFTSLDEEIMSTLAAQDRKDGSTATACFVDNETVWTVNVGDTRAVLCRLKNGQPKAIELSKEHTCNKSPEKKRVEKAGGMVMEANGHCRIVSKATCEEITMESEDTITKLKVRAQHFMEVSRSFGDPLYKGMGVISTPYISKFTITPNDQFIVIGCDGLFNAMTNKEMTEFVYEQLEHPGKPPLQEIVRRLFVEVVLNRKARDNVTVVLIVFRKT